MKAGFESTSEASAWVNPFKGAQGAIELAHACRDPYLLWAIFNRHKNKGVWELSDPPKFNIPVILQTVEELETLNYLDCKKDGAEIKNDYFAPLEPSLNGAHYCSAMVTAQFIQKPPKWVERLELSLPHSTEAFVVPKTVSSNTVNSVIPLERESTQSPDLQTRLPAIVGIIDDQFDFLNAYYAKDLAKTATRFLAVWDQNDHVALQTEKVWLEAQIDNHIQQFGRSYASYSGLNYPIKLRSHGVSVASVAIKNIAKCKPEEIDSEPNIVAVQLPSNTVVDTSGASLGAHALDAMHYIFNIAALHTPIAQTFKRPVVVNLSYGAIAGAHDGTSILEAAMDELLTLRAVNTAIVLPAGNSRETRTHLSGDIEPNAVFEFNWTMPPSDATDSFLEIWIDGDKSIEVQVIPPYGASLSGWVTEDTMALWQTSHCEITETVGALINIGKSTNSNLHKQTLIALAPTKYSKNVPNALISAGVFKIQVKNKSSTKINMQAWVERDDAVLGFDGGGQQSTLSYLDEAQQKLNTSQEVGTLNSIANGAHTISVAAYVQSNGEPCNYSGESLTGAFRKNKLTVAAPGDEGEGPWQGLEVCEALGSDTFRISGTSLATPAVTRWLADYMFNNITLKQPLTYKAIKQALEVQAVKDDKKKPNAPVSRIGSGRLNI